MKKHPTFVACPQTVGGALAGCKNFCFIKQPEIAFFVDYLAEGVVRCKICQFEVGYHFLNKAIHLKHLNQRF